MGRLAALCVLALGLAMHAWAAPGLRVEWVAPGVYAVQRAGVEANVVFIVNADDVVVVDAGATPASARVTIDILRAITDKPAAYLVYTSLHRGHIGGSAAWKEAFPLIEIVAHASAWDEADRIEAFAVEGERAAFPTMSVEDAMVLDRGERTIEIRHLGAGRSPGLVVHLPREGVVAGVDLLAAPARHWEGTPPSDGATLQRLQILGATTVISAHGPVLHDR